MQKSSGLQACNFLKKRLQHGCFPVNISKVLWTAFLREQFRGLLFSYLLVSERISKKEIGEIAFDLISLYKYKSLQAGLLPQEQLSCLQNFLNFIITKYLKQEVSDNLSACEDKHSPYGFSITGDTKNYQCLVIKRQWYN